MRILRLLPILAIVLLASSCGTTTTSSGYSVGTKMELSLSDMVCLGECEISCEYDTYLGVIRSLNKVNGKAYKPGPKVQLAGLYFMNKGMQLASAKVMEKYPDACYFQVVMDTKETDVLFLGSTTKRTAKIRAYKFK